MNIKFKTYLEKFFMYYFVPILQLIFLDKFLQGNITVDKDSFLESLLDLSKEMYAWEFVWIVLISSVVIYIFTIYYCTKPPKTSKRTNIFIVDIIENNIRYVIVGIFIVILIFIYYLIIVVLTIFNSNNIDSVVTFLAITAVFNRISYNLIKDLLKRYPKWK